MTRTQEMQAQSEALQPQNAEMATTYSGSSRSSTTSTTRSSRPRLGSRRVKSCRHATMSCRARWRMRASRPSLARTSWTQSPRRAALHWHAAWRCRRASGGRGTLRWGLKRHKSWQRCVRASWYVCCCCLAAECCTVDTYAAQRTYCISENIYLNRQRLNTEQRGDSTDEQATPRARTSASAYAA